MKFVPVNVVSGEVVLVNFDQVIQIWKDTPKGNTTLIFNDDKRLVVKEDGPWLANRANSQS